ncbi:MAG: DUF1003 domain-containing protein [Ferruginibacter sp.]|nr:DUF1003 domain-containing protein [Ferruginibacter sp.]
MNFDIIAFNSPWDVYHFILLHLIFSTQTAYAALIIMMFQNPQSN